MADAHALSPDVAEELDVESHAPYMRVWAILAVLTALEYFYALIFKDHFPLLVAGLLTMALTKAGMVGWYFMHLKFEKMWVYLLIVPACVMAVLLTLMMVPDMSMQPTEEELPGEHEVWVAPSLLDRYSPIPALGAALTGPAVQVETGSGSIC